MDQKPAIEGNTKADIVVSTGDPWRVCAVDPCPVEGHARRLLVCRGAGAQGHASVLGLLQRLLKSSALREGSPNWNYAE